jgi:hypothetical protein
MRRELTKYRGDSSLLPPFPSTDPVLHFPLGGNNLNLRSRGGYQVTKAWKKRTAPEIVDLVSGVEKRRLGAVTWGARKGRHTGHTNLVL